MITRWRLDPTHSAELKAAAEVLGLSRPADALVLIWPVLWASWLASGGHPDLPALAALLLALGFARSAAWAWCDPAAHDISGISLPRRRLGAVIVVPALCFSLPLGWPLPVLVTGFGLAALAFHWHRRSYYSQPVLALAVALAAVAAWLAQSAPINKELGLAAIAAFLWGLAAIALWLPGGASVRASVGSGWPAALAAMHAGAVAAFLFLGQQASLGVFHRLGLIAAAILSALTVLRARRDDGAGALVYHLWWGGAVFIGLAAHFLCACPSPPT